MKLDIRNDWEYLYYYLDSKKLDEKKSGKVLIKWPNGTKEWVPYKAEKGIGQYTEQGCPYVQTVNRYDWVVTITHKGFKIKKKLYYSKLNVIDVKQEA